MTSPNQNDPYAMQQPSYPGASNAPQQPAAAAEQAASAGQQPQPAYSAPSAPGAPQSAGYPNSATTVSANHAGQPGAAGQPGDSQWGYATQPGQAPYAAPTASNQYATMQTPAGLPSTPIEIGGGLGAIFRWTWNVFARNWVAFLVPGLIYGVIFAIALTVGMFIYFGGIMALTIPAANNGTDPSIAGIFGVMMLAMLVMGVIPAIVGLAWASGAANAAAIAARGGTPTFGQGMFSGKALLMGLVIGVIVFITAFIPIPVIGAWITGFFLTLAIPVMMLEDLGIVDSIKRSFRLTMDNIGIVLLGALLGGVIISAISMFMITVVITVPLQVLLQFAIYMVVTRRERAV